MRSLEQPTSNTQIQHEFDVTSVLFGICVQSESGLTWVNSIDVHPTEPW